MPQLDFATFPSQLFWLVVSFTLLYLLMTYVALPRMGKLLDARSSRIRADLDRAEQLKAEADSISHSYQASVTRAREEANKLLQAARDEASAKFTVRQGELARNLDAKIKQAESSIEDAKAKARQEVEAMAETLAQDLVKQLLKESNHNHQPMKKAV
ncbi:MAG: F0F1 ATP synthase subunit B' [Dongiaceae bacterium]